MNFESQFVAAHAVSTPLINVRTFDAESTIKAVEAFSVIYGDKGEKAKIKDALGVIVWDCIKGFSGKGKIGTAKIAAAIQSAGTVADACIELPVALRVASFLGQDCILFLSNAHLFWNEPTVLQGVWNLRDPFKSWGSMLILLTGNGAI